MGYESFLFLIWFVTSLVWEGWRRSSSCYREHVIWSRTFSPGRFGLRHLVSEQFGLGRFGPGRSGPANTQKSMRVLQHRRAWGCYNTENIRVLEQEGMRMLQHRKHEGVTTQKGMRVLQHRAWGGYNYRVHGKGVTMQKSMRVLQHGLAWKEWYNTEEHEGVIQHRTACGCYNTEWMEGCYNTERFMLSVL